MDGYVFVWKLCMDLNGFVWIYDFGYENHDFVWKLSLVWIAMFLRILVFLT